MEIAESIDALQGSSLHRRITQSIDVINRAIDLYGYVYLTWKWGLLGGCNDGPCLCRTAGLALSLNGGKDSTVLLHLIRAALSIRKHGGQQIDGLEGIVTFFFDKADDFPDVVQFTKDTDLQYSLKMKIYTSDFFSGLNDLLKEVPVQGIFLGTRSGDPNAGDQQIFSPSSVGWPIFMRINPIMEWSYHDIWEFLILCKVPYCSLYDKGYTSLGSVETTFPNVALARPDGNFSPAHMLQDPKLERSGRIKKVTKSPVARVDSFVKNLHTPTAGIVVIGDEILAAKVDDVNMKFLCKSLRSIGWLVTHVYFVGDTIDGISNAILDLSVRCDAVLTCGGLGPTLDDVTMKAVAKAIGRNIVKSISLEEKVKAHFGENVTKHHLKMAEVPDGPETALIEYTLKDGRPSPYPLVRCRNVYILPGVPSVVEQKWPAVRDDLAMLPTGENIERSMTEELPFSSVLFRLQCSDEALIAEKMEQVQKRFSSDVSVASYPLTDQSDKCTVALSLESKDADMLQEASNYLRSILDIESILSEHKNNDDALSSPSVSALSI